MSDILGSAHVSVRHCTALITDVQPAFNTVRVTFATTARARLRRVLLGDFLDGDTFHLRLVFEEVGEPVECPRVQVEVAVFSPVFRLVSVIVFADSREISHYDRSNAFLNTPFNNVFRKRMEIVGATSRLLLVQPGGLLGVRVITPGNLLAEVVVVLFQTVQWIQLAMAVFIGERGEVVDPEMPC